MPAAYDNSAQANNTTGVSTLTSGSFAVAGVNRVLYVLAGGADSGVSDVSGVKWGGAGGVALTKLGATQNISTVEKISLWRLIAPAASTSTVVVTYAGANAVVWLLAISVQDANQSTPEGTVATGSGTNASPTVNATSTNGDLILDFMSWLDTAASGRTISVGPGQTSRQEIEGATLLSQAGAACSTETAAGVSTTMSWTMSGAPSDGWATFAFQVNGLSPVPIAWITA